MAYISKYEFFRLNKDDAEKRLKNGEYRNLVNSRVGLTSGQTSGAIENLKGTLQISYPPPHASAGTLTIIGSYYSRDRNTVYFFVHDTNGHHAIYQLNEDVITLLLQWDGLNFVHDTYTDATGTYANGYINNIDVVGDDLYWVETANGPRVLNITKALAGEYLGVTEEMLSALRRPPRYPLIATKATNSGYDFNYIADHSFRFAYRYLYGHKASAISTYSKLAGFNESTDTFNYIQIDISDRESIPTFVTKIQILAQTDNGGFYVVKELEVGTTTFDFYNDILGIAVSNLEVGVPFDDIPINAYAQTFIKNRLWYGNCLVGYDAPEITMALSTVEVDNDADRLVDVYARYRYTLPGQPGYPTPVFDGHYVYDIALGVYFNCLYNPSTHTVTSIGTNQYTYDELIGGGFYYLTQLESSLNVGTGIPYVGRYYVENSNYNVGIVYRDFGGRNGGVSYGGSISIPEGGTGKYQIGWDLTGTTDIPIWATDYQIVMTKNKSWTFFIHDWASDLFYKRREVFSKDHDGAENIIVDITGTVKNGIGYILNEGDRIILTLSSVDYEFEILSQDGNFLYLEGKDIGTFGLGDVVEYFIYTPIREANEDIYYEVGECHSITDSGTASRQLSTISGTIDGDVAKIERNSYGYSVSGYDSTDPYGNTLEPAVLKLVFAMSPNDKHYEKWYTHHGRANVITEIGQQRYPTLIKYTGEKLPSSTYNALNRMNSQDRYDKIQEDRTPIISMRTLTEDMVLCNHVGTVSSLYAGVGFLKIKDGSEFLAKTDGVITDDRRLQGDYGALAHTIKTNGQRAWWVDYHRQSIVRYTVAGTQSISEMSPTVDYKVDRFFRDIISGTADIRTISVGYDPEYDEVLTTFNGRTYVFSEKSQFWMAEYELKDASNRGPLHYFCNTNKMYGSPEGAQIWKHNASSTYNLLYGVQRTRSIDFIAAEEPGIIKVYNNLWVEGEIPDTVVITNENSQQTTLVAADFVNYETIMKSPIWFDENSTGGLRNGYRMRSGYAKISMSSSKTTISPLYVVSVLWDQSPYTR